MKGKFTFVLVALMCLGNLFAQSIPELLYYDFNGSGTTIHAANELGRKWIGIDQSFTAAEATLKRLRYGMEKMGDYVKEKETAKTADMFSAEPPHLLSKPSKKEANFTFFVDSDVLEKHSDQVKMLSKI